MKIALAQLASVGGKVLVNIKKHIQFIEKCAAYDATLIVFPELSITGYEPTVAKKLAKKSDDPQWDIFQELAIKYNIVISIGMPTISSRGICISNLYFSPNTPRQVYSKRYLHEDEKPYFISGIHSHFIEIGNEKIAPAICYESLLSHHIEAAHSQGTKIYLANVAKPQSGIDKAEDYFPVVARKYQMTILMVNTIGKSDDFISVGKSAIWNTQGEKIGLLEKDKEGILILDTVENNVLQIVV